MAAYREHVVDEFCTRTAPLQWPAGPKRSAGFCLRTGPGAEADGSAMVDRDARRPDPRTRVAALAVRPGNQPHLLPNLAGFA